MVPRRQVNPDYRPKNPKLSWDTYQRQVLCCLYRFFECSNDQVSALFSKIFRDDLVHCGFGRNDIPYRTLNAQWCWLRRQKRPVWHHVHVATEFRTDGEWKDIIHLIRLAAFELGILLNEKRNNTIVIPDDEFDVNENPWEFLTSVLLTNPARPRDSSSFDDPGDACAYSSVEDTGDFNGYFSGDAHLDSSVASAPLLEGFSSDASRSTLAYFPDTPTTVITPPTPVSSSRFGRFRDAMPISPTIQSPAMDSYAGADTHTTYDSSQDFEPLVTSHDKVCFWCKREGENLHDGTPTAEHNLGIAETRESHNHWIDDLSAPSPRLDIQRIASVDVNIDRSDNLEKSGELPGLCGSNDLPPLLYRWHNTNSQGINTETVLVAGWFTATYPDVGSPGQMSQSDFLNVFAAHVTRVQVPTPFISAFARPLAPIHRALRNPENAKISVIDPQKLLTAVFHAHPLAQITQTTVKRWKGYGEFAIWGYIPSEAIVCSIDIASLEGISLRDLEIQLYLQLSLIQAQETSHRRLRRDLRTNLHTCSYEDNRSVLMRLAQKLGVPEEYQEYFATDIHQAWTMDFGDTWRDREELHDPMHDPEHNSEHDPEISPEPAVSGEIPSLNQVAERVVRCNSESTTSYVPPKSDDGSWSESTSEEEDDMSQSPEAPCPQRDTPSSAFSVASDTDDSVEVNVNHLRAADIEMAEVAILPTPPSTSRYFGHSSNINPAVPPLTLSRLSLSNSLNDDHNLSEGAEWPSDGETLAGNDTPTKSRYFDQHGNEKENEKPPVSHLTLQGRNPFVLSADEMVEL